MNRCAWSGTLLPGKRQEYERRHREQSAEFRALFGNAGIHNYSIWCNGDKIFAYMETEGDFEDARKALNESPAFQQWKEDMKDLIRIDTCPETGEPVWLEEVYYNA